MGVYLVPAQGYGGVAAAGHASHTDVPREGAAEGDLLGAFEGDTVEGWVGHNHRCDCILYTHDYVV